MPRHFKMSEVLRIEHCFFKTIHKVKKVDQMAPAGHN